MKKLLLILPLVFARIARADDIYLLHCIALVESGNNPLAVGQAGEVSAYQILPATWKHYTTRPLLDARDPLVALSVARKHLEYLRTTLLRFHREGRLALGPGWKNDPYIIGKAWRWGPHGALSYSPAKSEYCRRIANLYEDYTLRQ